LNNDYLFTGIQEILRQAQERNPDMQPNITPGLTPEQSLEQTIISRMLDIRSLDVKGTFIVDSHGEKLPLSLHIKGMALSKQGFPINYDNELFFTMPDGTSLGEYAECMNHGEIVHKDNLHRCPVCGKTCCVLCGKYSKTTDKYYCCGWHKFLQR
jgi:predicted RNA-binding Zn-ribbon protein involved in translation (DUF1610 family)